MSENVKNTETQSKAPSKGKNVVKAIFNTIINILIVIVLITSLLIAVISLTSKASGISTIFGYTVQPIQSDSMKGGSPDGYKGGDFEKGDLMIAKATNFDENKEYSIGDIITYRTKDSDGNDFLMSHRIVDAIKDESGNLCYQTWGDNRTVSQAPDQTDLQQYLHAYDIASVFYSNDYHGKILKGWGAPLDFLRTQQGFFFVVLLPMIIFFLYALVRVVLSASDYRKSKAKEDKDEAVKAAVAAALAEKGVQADDTQAVANTLAPADAPTPQMSAEEMEQFRQFQEFQKMQKAQQEAQAQPAEEPKAETDNTPEE
nr:hypothetical protein [uncultured Ruminococcus sp.]